MPGARTLIASGLLAAGLWAAGGAAIAEEPEAPASRDEIVAYRESGEWARDTRAVIEDARRQLERSDAARPALVLDVDDTALSNYRCMARRGFRPAPGRPQCAASGRLPAIPQTLSLYREARRLGVTVVFITGRHEWLRPATVANLRRAGYRGRLRLHLRPDREPPGTHDGYKARTRRALQRHGLTIVANVGDQRSDLTGGAAQGTFKLPNPMYVIRSA